jgi:MoaA/NifB/PqqE/SkfB family radical SAM enzyme
MLVQKANLLSSRSDQDHPPDPARTALDEVPPAEMVGRETTPFPVRADGYAALPPKWIILGINNVCNLKCKMCDVGLGNQETVFWANLIGNHPQNMQRELLAEIVRQAGGFTPAPKIGIAFTEPLLHPHLVDFARTIVEAGLHCAITSNGTALARVADALVEVGVQDLALSLDGPGDIHNRIRGGKETFQKICEGVEALNAAKRRQHSLFPRLTISFTITDANYHHILAFVREMEAFNADQIIISQLNFISTQMADAHNALYAGDLKVERSNLGDMEPSAFETEAIAAELERVRAYADARGGKCPAITFVPDTTDNARLDTYYREPLVFVGGRQCTDPWKMLMVRTDGSVIPAHGRCYNYPVGDVRTATLPEIWNSPRFQAFRRTLQAGGGTLPACARCCGIIGKAAPQNANAS